MRAVGKSERCKYFPPGLECKVPMPSPSSCRIARMNSVDGNRKHLKRKKLKWRARVVQAF